jgi:prefoldin subunit 5
MNLEQRLSELEARVSRLEKEAAAATTAEIEKHLNDLPNSTKEIIQKEIEKAKQSELIVGIDPESYLAKEILWQSRKMIELEHSVSKISSSINRLKRLLSKS